MNKTAIVIGSGSAGLIAAKELKDKGIDVKIIDKNPQQGGIWGSMPWKSYTLTSSKWVTEYGCFPMPEDYPDFITNEQMLAYLDSFAEQFGLKQLIDHHVNVSAINKENDGRLTVETDKGDYTADIVVVGAGLHGKPFTPEFPGIDNFLGDVVHSSSYVNPDAFSGKKVLCVGLGESGVGLVAELAPATAKLVVSSEGVAVAPRVIKGSQNPFDQMQFWQIGKHMIGYQELLTSGLSWFYRKIPRIVKKISISTNLKFYSDYGVSFEQFEPWFPKAMIPQHFHVKFWAKPMNCPTNGNLTRPQAPADDLFYLIKTGNIIPKGKIASFDTDGVIFADGSREDVDTIIFNTGYQPGSSSIRFPNDWQYKHLDLYKGCLHYEIPNLAFVGLVRPTIGSIPAMAEMHSRIIAAYLSGHISLPELEQRQMILEKDNAQHQAECPQMHDRFPHIYFFDEWMDQMADIIGVRPRLKNHLSSFADFKTYFFGSPMPLRYRIHGDGAIDDARETYIKRVMKIWGNAFGRWASTTVIIHLLVPYVLTLAAFLIPYLTYGLPLIVALFLAALFHTLYRTVDFFRYLFETGVSRTLSIAIGVFFIKKIKDEIPNYQEPIVFQRLD